MMHSPGGIPSPQAPKRAATPDDTCGPSKKRRMEARYSPAGGSDDEQLIIDDPSLPTTKRASTSAAAPEGSALSPSPVKIPPHSPVAHSPIIGAKSPAAVSTSGSSPCVIDDDLMDDAILISKDGT